MRTHQHHHAATHRRAIRKLPAGLLHAPMLDEGMELFSDRLEDILEYQVIMRDFASLHDAEVEADTYA